MRSNKFNVKQLLILYIILISLLNFITILSDSNKSSKTLLEKISENLYYLSSPLLFENLQDNINFSTSISEEDNSLKYFLDNLLKENKVNILEGFSENINKKFYLVIKNDYKDLDKLFYTSFFEFKKFYLFIDNEILRIPPYLNLKNLINGGNKNLLFKAHIINEKNINKSFLKDKKVLKSRIQRAIKERSCNVIINLTKNKIDTSIRNELFSKSFFIKSIKTKQRLYLSIAVFAIILNLLLILKLSKIFKLLSNHFLLFYKINSIFLLLYYIFSLFFSSIFYLNFHFLSFFILYFQISFFFLFLLFIIKFLEKIEENEDKNYLILRFLLIFIVTFLISIIINTSFFSNLTYWLKPVQYLTYFFYFFPIILLLILNFKQEKLKIIIYIIGAIFLYFLFKLRDSGFFLTNTEIYIRDFLESFLPARFRFREFLFYFFCFFFFFLSVFNKKILTKIIKLKNKYPTFFTYITLFPFLSIINSYYHSYTPMYISFLRTIFAFIFAFLLSGFVFLIFIGFYKLLKKYIKNAL